MKIKFLGTGGSVGTPEIGCQCRVCLSKDTKNRRKRASVLVSVNNLKILIDCGPDFKEQILPEPFEKIDAVLLTHEHYDHVSGIDDLRAFGHFGDVNIYTNHKTSEALKTRMPYCFAEVKYPGVPRIQLTELTDDCPFYINNLQITPINVIHYKLPIFGYRIANFAYLTDVLTLPETEYEKLYGLHTLVISALRHEEHLAHQTVERALEVIELIKPQKAYLTHVSHSIGLHSEECAKLPENISIAYDGLELII